MAKKIDGYIKLQIPAGAATPAPPVGPALGQKSVNIMDFCKQFNARTSDQQGMIIPVVITVYTDRSFDFVCKTPPAAVLIKKAAGIEHASGNPKHHARTGRRDRKDKDAGSQCSIPRGSNRHDQGNSSQHGSYGS